MRKKYNTPHRSRVVKTRLSEDECPKRYKSREFEPPCIGAGKRPDKTNLL